MACNHCAASGRDWVSDFMVVQEGALRCDDDSESESESERLHGTHPPPTDFSAQLPFLLGMLAAFPPKARVCVAAAAGLDGEASVLVAARLAVLRGTSALEALISVSHTRLALHLQVCLILHSHISVPSCSICFDC